MTSPRKPALLWSFEKRWPSLQYITRLMSELAFAETPWKDWLMWSWAKLPQLLVVQWRKCSHEVSQLMRQKVTIPHNLREAIQCRLRLLIDQIVSTNHKSFSSHFLFTVFGTGIVIFRPRLWLQGLIKLPNVWYSIFDWKDSNYQIYDIW